MQAIAIGTSISEDCRLGSACGSGRLNYTKESLGILSLWSFPFVWIITIRQTIRKSLEFSLFNLEGFLTVKSR